MTQIPGTNISDKIVPNDTNDTFATHDEIYGAGGWRSVANSFTRDLIPTDRRKEGMIVNVLDIDRVYKLKNGVSNSNWEIFTTTVSGDNLQGAIELTSSDIVYTIQHPALTSLSSGYPIISLQVPTSGDNLLVAGITNRTLSSFDVVVSQIPNTTGYFIDWSMNSNLQGPEGLQGIQGISGGPGPRGIQGISGNSLDPSLYTLLTTSASISGGFNTRITTLETYTNGITGGLTQLDNRFVNIIGNETIDGIKTFNEDIKVKTFIFGYGGGNIETNIVVGSGLDNNTIGEGNVVVGIGGMRESITSYNTTAIGNNALTLSISGSDNTAIGQSSLYFNTGSNNSAVGSQTLANNLFGINNTAMGTSALGINTGSNNVAIGYQAGADDVSGSNKLYIANTQGTSSDALIYGDFLTGKVYIKGQQILTSYVDMAYTPLTTTESISAYLQSQITSLSGGTYVDLTTNQSINGFKTFVNGISSPTSSGTLNEAFGLNALHDNIYGVSNTAVGYNSLYKNTLGNSNISLGSYSLYNNLDGHYNVAVGGGSPLYFNTSGNYNVAVGFEGLYKNTNGGANVALGGLSLYNNTIGSYNIASGYQALYNNISGVANVAIGVNALCFCNNDSNVAIGLDALHGVNGAGKENTGIGLYAGFVTIGIGSGSSNTMLGARTSVDSGAAAYRTAIGASAYCLNDNTIRCGRASTDTLRGYNYTADSDRRLKENIVDLPLGLDFIMTLRPVSYKWKDRTFPEVKDENGKVTKEAEHLTYSRNHCGFIAQEIGDALKVAGVDYGVYQDSGVAKGITQELPVDMNNYIDPSDLKGYSVEQMLAIAVKAIQELKDEIKTLKINNNLI